jgi:hypothetical protein
MAVDVMFIHIQISMIRHPSAYTTPGAGKE